MEDNNPDRSRRSFKLQLLIPTLILSLPILGFVFAQSAEGGPSVQPSQILLLAGLLILSALMSGSETALTAIGSWKVRQLREDGDDPGGVFALLERQPTRFITTLLIGNNLVNIAATALVTQISINLARSSGFSEALAVGYATGVMTLLVLIFGEITPKSIAVHNAVGFSRLVIRPVYFLSIVLYPVGLAFTWITSSLLRLFRLEPSGNPLITENELRLMLRSAEESGVIEAQEEAMIKGVIDLEETVVREVMTPRVDVIAVGDGESMHEVLKLVDEHGYSRLPVYAESIDDIIGVVYARDLLAYLDRPDSLLQSRVAEVASPPAFVPETLSVLSLLRDMRVRQNHLAIVVDEFGGTSGVVTLEDIIEEITGEIYDESDQPEEEEIVALDEGSFRIQGSAHLEDVGDELNLTFVDDGEFDTLAGFLINEFGYIPDVGEMVEHQGVRFLVQEADERRIIEVLARADASSEADAPAFDAVPRPSDD